MRIDKYCAEHYGSRTKAAQSAQKGEILLNGRAAKPSDEVKEGDSVSYVTPNEKFVSNGGYKLSRAISTFQIDCTGLVFADIGASTGGFTDCLLQNNAKKVYCVDVGESQLDENIAKDKRVVVMDNTNARYLTEKDFPEKIDGVVIDVSFISLELILPVLYTIVRENGFILALIKPQFECEDKKILSKSGIVTDPKLRLKIVTKIYNACIKFGFKPVDIVNAPLREKKNVEYVIWLKKGQVQAATLDKILLSAKNLI